MPLFSHPILKFFVFASLLSLAYSSQDVNWNNVYRAKWENTGIHGSSSGTIYRPKPDECTNWGVLPIENDEKPWGTIAVGETISTQGQSKVVRAVLKFEQESNGQKEADFHGVLKYVEHEGANNAVIEGAQLAKSIAIHWRRQSKKQRPFPYIVEPRV